MHRLSRTDDEWMTPPRVVAEMVDTYIGDDTDERAATLVWEPFVGDGVAAEYLKNDLGVGVTLGDHSDFFDCDTEPDGVTMVLSNPPFSRKIEVCRRLCELDVPWVLVLPMSCLHSVWLRRLRQVYGARHFQFRIPAALVYFRRAEDEVDFERRQAPFQCLFLSFKRPARTASQWLADDLQ